MKIVPSTLSTRQAHHLFVSIISPRPIAWVSTIDNHGIKNLAPFSQYLLLSVNPSIIGFVVGTYRDGSKKDTLKNIEANKEFVINVVTEDVAKAMNITSTPYPHEVSEFDKAKLTPVKSELISPFRVGESPVNLECRSIQTLTFGKEPVISNLLIGEVLLVHVKDVLWDGVSIDSSMLKVIGRLGGGTDLYCHTTDTFEMKSPQADI